MGGDRQIPGGASKVTAALALRLWEGFVTERLRSSTYYLGRD
jgi:hypothetical protein